MSETIITVRAPRDLVRALDRIVRERNETPGNGLYTRSLVVRELLLGLTREKEPVARRRGK